MEILAIVNGEVTSKFNKKDLEVMLKTEDYIAGIYDLSHNRVLICLDPEFNSTEKSGGVSGTHYQMRQINSFYVTEYESEFQSVNLSEDDTIPNSVDFDIVYRDSQMIATLSHKIAGKIPGVVGIDKAQTKYSWYKRFGSLRSIYYQLNCIQGINRSLINKSLEKMAKACNESSWKFEETFFNSISEADYLQVAIAKKESGFAYMAMCHADIPGFETMKCFNGKIFINDGRFPSFRIEIDT